MESSRLLCESNFCRLCGEENENNTSLFPETENDEDLSELINKYLPLKVKNDGKLPTCICPGCNIQLEATKQFLDLIIEGQAKLREIFRLQQDVLKRQEKQRRQLENALKTVNPSSSVEAYTIKSDEAGEKFMIQIFSEGPLFSPDHEASLRADGLQSPRKKRGRPAKQPPPNEEDRIEIREEKVSDEEEPEMDSDGRRKRKRKVPSRLLEAVQGKELDRIFKDANLEPEKSSAKPSSEEVVGRLTNELGEELGELVVINKNTNRLRIKSKSGQNDKKKKYHCEICDKEFLHTWRYEAHRATHRNVIYQCANETCSLQFATKEYFDEHQSESGHSDIIFLENIENDEMDIEKQGNADTNEKQSKTVDSPKGKDRFVCEDCNKTFSCKQNYEVHMKAIHENSRPYQCDKCEKSFAYPNSLKCHMLQHTDKSEKMYTCKTCAKVFNHPSSLLYHREAEHNGKRFICNKCNKSFKHKQLLQRHQLVHSTDRPHSCKVCDGNFKTRANLLNHMTIHSGVKKYFCTQCGQSFAHKTSLTLHTRWHSGQKPYQCDVCKKSFSQKGNLAEHKRIHTGEKPFCCDQCGRKFTTSSQFKLHIKRHTGEKPWKCEYCVKTFLHRDTWKCHTRRHRNERPFQCKECFRGFTEQWALKKHERLHLGIKPYECDVCFRGFADCSNLTKHKRIHLDDHMANSKLVDSANEVSNQVLYFAYEGNSNDSQQSTLVQLMNPLDANENNETLEDEELLSSSVLNDSLNEKLLQQIMDQDGASLSITTADGQEIKVVTREEDGQQTIQGLLQDGSLVPLNLSFQERKPLCESVTDMVDHKPHMEENVLIQKIEHESSVVNLLNSNMQILNDQKLGNNLILTEDGQNICLVTSLNIDETVSPQYLSIT